MFIAYRIGIQRTFGVRRPLVRGRELERSIHIPMHDFSQCKLQFVLWDSPDNCIIDALSEIHRKQRDCTFQHTFMADRAVIMDIERFPNDIDFLIDDVQKWLKFGTWKAVITIYYKVLKKSCLRDVVDTFWNSCFSSGEIIPLTHSRFDKILPIINSSKSSTDLTYRTKGAEKFWLQLVTFRVIKWDVYPV